MKRGFPTKREALEWEREFLNQKSADMDMLFASFYEIYAKDIQKRLKRNTWQTKESIIEKKILPYFGKRKMCEIKPADVIAWQNELIAHRDENGNPYAATYLKTVHNQLSTIFNHGVRFYELQSNPAAKAGNMGKEKTKEMLFWTKEELTSERNHLGKSIIMKSIYYTLGAEVYFPAPIKNINLLTYIDFTLGEYTYRVARLNRSFVLYCDGKFIDHYNSISAFGDALSNILKLEINLVGKDPAGTIEKCPPAIYFMPYYIDQENGWSPSSISFEKLTQFDLPQRKNSYFFHLGVLDNEYVEISKRKKANERQIAALTKEIEKYRTVIETLRIGFDDTQMSYDIDSLEQAIRIRKQEIKIILDDVAKTRNDLIEAEDRHLQLTHDKQVLTKYIKKKNNKAEQSEPEVVECPRCGMFFERTLAQKLEKTYLLASLHDDYATTSSELVLLEKKINKLSKKFREKQDLLKDYEKSLTNDKDTYDAYLKSKATNQMLKEYYEIINSNASNVEKLSKDNTKINEQLRYYAEDKTQVNLTYLNNLNKLLVELDIPKGQVDENSEPGSALAASGAYGPRCKIAQALSFLETQRKVSPGITAFPLIIDSPNVLEQDSQHLDSVIRTLLTWDKTENQIIVASIQGKEIAASIPGVNIITLTNPQNHLLENGEYQLYEDEISELFTSF